MLYNQHHENEEYVYSIEDYLDRVCAPLVCAIPRSRREEIRGRVRDRIERFAVARREAGCSEGEAVELALAKCGDPALIAARWLPDRVSVPSTGITTKRSNLKGTDAAQSSIRAATTVATITFGLPYLLDATRVTRNLFTETHVSAVIYYRVWLFVMPLLAGLLTGILVKNKPVRGVANAIALLTIPAVIVPGIVYSLASAKIGPDLTRLQFADPLAGICGLAPWLLIGAAGSALGRRMRLASSSLGAVLRRRRNTGDT